MDGEGRAAVTTRGSDQKEDIVFYPAMKEEDRGEGEGKIL